MVQQGQERVMWPWIIGSAVAIAGLCVGWVAGSIIVMLREEPFDIWEWDED
jgi:ribose/xylose/arabinose/galactoside ABC-type transport system permease subunit